MGLFTPRYLKEGKGVDKDAPRKRGIFLYFEIFGRKLSRLFQISWIYALFSVPYLVLMFLFVIGFFGEYIANRLEGVITPEDMQIMLTISSALVTAVLYVLWGSGPASAGIAYITRCFTREEPIFMFSDFFDKFKENFKQSMIIVVVDFVFLYLMVNAMIQYGAIYTANNNIVFLIMLYVCIMLFVVYTFIHFHIYQLMVTYDCKLKDLYKNALLLALGKSPMNLFLLAFAAAGTSVLFNYIQPYFALLLCVFVLYPLLRFPIEYYSARTIVRILNNSKGA